MVRKLPTKNFGNGFPTKVNFLMENYTVKILVVRYSSIGDIVLTTPIVRCLKQQLEGNVEIHYLTKKSYRSLLENNPYITKIHTIEKNNSEVVEQLKNEQFDYIIDLHKNLRSKGISRKLGTLRFTFDKLNVKKWLLTNFKINTLPDIHIVDRYFEAVKCLGVENDGKGLDFFLTENDKVTNLPETHNNGYVTIAIGAQFATKCLPTNKLVELCNLIHQPIILAGGKEDEQKANEIISQSSNKNIYNACGKYSINQSAFIVKNSETLITHDTGLMHIGAALGVNIISIWGNTVPTFGMYPYLPKEKYVIIENNNLNCRPCSKIGYDACPKKHFKCMNDLSMQEVVDELGNRR